MSHYAYEVEEATAFLDMDHFILFNGVKRIQDAARTERWCGYGWRDELLKAQTADDVARIFGIGLVDEGAGFCRPIIDGIYVSRFFDTLIDIMAPFMTNGFIKVDDEYNIVTIVFEDGKALVYRDEREDDEPVENTDSTYEKCVALMNEAIDEKNLGSATWNDFILGYSKGIAHALTVLGFEHKDMSKLCN